jgi:polypeptide N-acetylgalactosaminyltransferase
MFRRSFMKFWFLYIILIIIVAYAFYDGKFNNAKDILQKNIESLRSNPLYEANKYIYPVVTNYEKKDWHDYEFIKYEASRQGPGEQGTAHKLENPEDIKLNDELYKVEGINVIVSDKISVNRSLPDTRNKGCKSIKYLKQLPKTSVIVIFYNEHWSILLRTLHGIHNRTPPELLHEIILVNDASTKKNLYDELRQYCAQHFDGKVKLIVLPKRMGLIVTRMEGAKRATGEVLVFLDAHIEVNVNWLPPLLGKLNKLMITY